MMNDPLNSEPVLYFSLIWLVVVLVKPFRSRRRRP
tara:strand:+ start:511 stop:615 length:105 start_codon:yes stop_codon:yes gene_type:complete